MKTLFNSLNISTAMPVVNKLAAMAIAGISFAANAAAQSFAFKEVAGTTASNVVVSIQGTSVDNNGQISFTQIVNGQQHAMTSTVTTQNSSYNVTPVSDHGVGSGLQRQGDRLLIGPATQGSNVGYRLDNLTSGQSTALSANVATPLSLTTQGLVTRVNFSRVGTANPNPLGVETFNADTGVATTLNNIFFNGSIQYFGDNSNIVTYGADSNKFGEVLPNGVKKEWTATAGTTIIATDGGGLNSGVVLGTLKPTTGATRQIIAKNGVVNEINQNINWQVLDDNDVLWGTAKDGSGGFTFNTATGALSQLNDILGNKILTFVNVNGPGTVSMAIMQRPDGTTFLGAGPQAVPEPAPSAALGLGALAVIKGMKRRKSANKIRGFTLTTGGNDNQPKAKTARVFDLEA